MKRRRTRGDYDIHKARDMLDNPITIEKFKVLMDKEYDDAVSFKKGVANPWTKPFMYVVTGHPEVGDRGELQNAYERTADDISKFKAQLKNPLMVGWKIGVAHGKSAQKTSRLQSYAMHWGKSNAKIGWFQIQPNSHYADKKSVLLRKEQLLKAEMRKVVKGRGKWQGQEWFIATVAEMREALGNMQRQFDEGDNRTGYNGQGNRFSPRIRLQENVMFDFAKDLLAQTAEVRCNLPSVADRIGKGARAYEREYCRVVFKAVPDEEVRRYIRARRGQEAFK